jgi:hypothetical protein
MLPPLSAALIDAGLPEGGFVPMSETLTVGLNKQQREILLRGLRFVRSAVMLDIREPSAEVDADRATQVREIGRLVEQLEGSRPAGAPARV